MLSPRPLSMRRDCWCRTRPESEWLIPVGSPDGTSPATLSALSASAPHAPLAATRLRRPSARRRRRRAHHPAAARPSGPCHHRPLNPHCRQQGRSGPEPARPAAPPAAPRRLADGPVSHLRLEVADISRRYGPDFRDWRSSALTDFRFALMRTDLICRTAALGGQVAGAKAKGTGGSTTAPAATATAPSASGPPATPNWSTASTSISSSRCPGSWPTLPCATAWFCSTSSSGPPPPR